MPKDETRQSGALGTGGTPNVSNALETRIGGRAVQGGAPLPAVSRPKGGGAIRGMDEKFAADPATGSASMTVPIPTSAGRSGFGPQLSLAYDSGAGNGPFGFGWTLSLPSITRKTSRGIPRYDDGSESDVFVLSGVEDLVPVLRANGGRHEDSASHPGFTVHRYRPRVEHDFARIERWTEVATGDVHWRVISRENVTSILGRDNDSRVFDPEEAGSPHPKRIFEWRLCQSYDDRGNAIVYEFAGEDDVRVNRMHAHERNRRRTANRYIKRIKYGNRVSRLIQPDLSQSEWLFEIVFDYDEDHYRVLPLDGGQPAAEQHRFVQASNQSNGNWGIRPDSFSVYRQGFEVRTHRRCRRVLTFHRFDELGAEPCLVRAVELEYEDLVDYERAAPPSVETELGHQGSSRFGSLLRRIVHSGYTRDARPVQLQNGLRYVTYLQKSFPPLEFEYSRASIRDEVLDIEQGRASLPLDGNDYRWVDLDGEGVSGILTKQAGAWHYEPNLGNAKLGTMQVLRTQPAKLPRAVGGEQLLDLSGDGQLDLVSFSPDSPGFYERTDEFDWDPFVAFHQLPNIPWEDPNARLVDLTGDGQADVLITEQEVFTWYPSLGEGGFDGPCRVRKAQDEASGPSLVFADGTQSIYLADMSGDGLVDLVRVRNGEVSYWPNLGYGKFGGRVRMDNAPWFTRDEQFDHSRLRLADIDGSGTTDLLYVGDAGVRIYFNQSGNGWSEAHALRSVPRVDDPSSVATVDLYGNGTTCLVWSSSLPMDADSALRFVDLMGGQKPHLLTKSNNHLGNETHVTYASSTQFYLEDKRRGKPWVTRIPFPVQVVQRIDVYDRISQNHFVTRYAYHHGYFDGHEREFGGFGLVEQYDAKEFGALSGSGSLPQGSDASFQAPPVLTKTWFHTGVFMGRQHVSDFFAGLEESSGAGEYFREPGADDSRARELLLDDTNLPAGLTAQEAREACRALRGSLLRQEVYASDGSAKEALPYTVSERNFDVKCLQRRGANRHGVFFSHPREDLSFDYERSLVPVLAGVIVDAATAATDPSVEWQLDPRVTHSLTLEVDEFGEVLKAARAHYGRRFEDPSLSAAIRNEQAQVRLTYDEERVTNAIDGPNDYRVPEVYDSRRYELTGYVPSGSAGRFRRDDLVAPVSGSPDRYTAVFDDELSYEASATSGKQRRLIEHVRTVFRRNDLVDSLPLGQLESMGLPLETYTLALTSGLVRQVFNEEGALDRVSDSMLLESGGYVHSRDESGALDDDWWAPSGRVFFSPGADDLAAQELDYARTHFFLPHRLRDPFHTPGVPTESFVSYDRYDLLLSETRDALGNRTSVGVRNLDPTQPLVAHGQDYRVLQPALVMDPNRNRVAYAFDALGMVVGTALMGKPEDAPAVGDTLSTNFRVDLTDAELEAFLAAPNGPLAAQWLAEATARFIWDPFAYARNQNPSLTRAPFVATLAREAHSQDAASAGDPRIQISFAYSDGFGREVQKKVQAEPGPVPVRDANGAIVVDARNQPVLTPNSVSPRWVASGWTLFDNKGQPVRRYEPYFTDAHEFEFDVRIGQSPILFYDPLGRVVARLHPNHTWEKEVFGPWQSLSWDASDTVTASPSADADVGGFFARLAVDEYAPTWHALRTDPALSAELAARYPDVAARGNEQAAAGLSEIHANTPSRTYSDSLGRSIATVDHNRFRHSNSSSATEEFYETRAEFDILGNLRQVSDGNARVVARYDYDLLGTRIHQASMEAGERWSLTDAVGKPVMAWSARGYRFRNEYDALRRPTKLWLEADAQEALIGQTEYGESRPNPEADNLRGAVVQQWDQAGTRLTDRYDFKGNLLRTTQRLAEAVGSGGHAEPAYKNRLDWHGVVTLQLEAYVSETRFDALSRPTQLILPHSDQGGSTHVVQPSYNDAGLLERVDVWLDQGSVPSALLDGGITPPSAVGIANIDYDANARRSKIDYRNGASTSYRYDPYTLQLVQLRTEQPGAAGALQNLHYTYDAYGNITHVRDTAQQALFFANAKVEAGNEFIYDSVFRLIEATGREHLGQTGSPVPHSYNDAPRVARAGIPHPNDGQALGRYVERYSYDPAGNITRLHHGGTAPASSAWTRTYQYNEPSQLEAQNTSNRLTSTQVGNGSPITATYSVGGDGYDAHGNLLRMPHLQSLRWNERDQLQMTQRQAVSQTDAEGVLRQGERTWYVYDASGKRIRKVTELASGQLKDERIYLDGVEIYRRPANNLVRQTLHIMDDDQRLALVEIRVAGSEPGIPRELVRYQLADHLGSSCLELDDQGRVLTYEEYSPYGSTTYQAVHSQTQAPKRYRYTGMERDEESGLAYHSTRYYASWLGRWTSSDPAGLIDGLNLYSYVRNNPQRLVDPSGTAGEKALTKDELKKFGGGATFIKNAEAWISTSIAEQKKKIETKKAKYKRKNWKWTAEDSKDQDARIAELESVRDNLRKELRAGIGHGIDLLNLANVVYNEAGTSNDTAKLAIAYGWLNFTGGKLRLPEGEEISHFKSLRKRWSDKPGTSDRLTLLKALVPSIQAARKRLDAKNPAKTDPLGGADHWVSPKGLKTYDPNKPKHKKERYKRTVETAVDKAFPKWARDPKSAEAKAMIKAGSLEKNFDEFTLKGVPRLDFLFYRGVK